MLTKVIEQAKIDRFARWMGHAERIVIVAHVAPDGDAIGSSLGLWHFLNSQDKTVNVIVPNVEHQPDFHQRGLRGGFAQVGAYRTGDDGGILPQHSGHRVELRLSPAQWPGDS